WSYWTGDWVVSSPAIVNGVVYVGSNDNKVYALNAATGAKKWSYTTGDYYNTTGDSVSSSPAVANGIVYVGSEDGKVYALNAQTGTKLWSYWTGDWVVSSPAIVNGIVYVGSNNNKVYALNAATGAKKWSYTTGDDVSSSPAVANGIVYVGSNDNKVYALNAATGAKKWSYTTGDWVDSSPAVVNGVVYVGGDDNKLYAFGPSLTTLTIATSPTAPKLNVAFTVSGTLKSGTSGLKGLSVHLERKIVGGSWTTVAGATKNTGTGGVVSVSQKVTSHNTYSYRWHFIGTASYQPSYSPVKTFTV
ncbi:MAG: PQQ-binding-like beta-propeller repeat protein, partial [Euryarchaeota archaeon]